MGLGKRIAVFAFAVAAISSACNMPPAQQVMKEASLFRKHSQYQKAIENYHKALEIDPEHVKGRFYLGSALAQRAEEIPKAIEIWSSLEKDSAPDAPWLELLRENIRVAKAELAAAATAPQ